MYFLLLGFLSNKTHDLWFFSHASPDLNMVYSLNHSCGVWILQKHLWYSCPRTAFCCIGWESCFFSPWSDSLRNCAFHGHFRRAMKCLHVDEAVCISISLKNSAIFFISSYHIICAQFIPNVLVLCLFESGQINSYFFTMKSFWS